MSDSNNNTHYAKLPADDPRYKAVVAEPVMEAVDSLPAAYRHLVHEYGYVDVYLAWKHGKSAAQIEAAAKKNNGIFRF